MSVILKPLHWVGDNPERGYPECVRDTGKMGWNIVAFKTRRYTLA
ncbi:MAG: hypothetical protein AAF468_02080 [Pseudomonadota bacterium]